MCALSRQEESQEICPFVVPVNPKATTYYPEPIESVLVAERQWESKTREINSGEKGGKGGVGIEASWWEKSHFLQKLDLRFPQATYSKLAACTAERGLGAQHFYLPPWS